MGRKGIYVCESRDYATSSSRVGLPLFKPLFFCILYLTVAGGNIQSLSMHITMYPKWYIFNQLLQS
jgi:hypothetical protein